MFLQFENLHRKGSWKTYKTVAEAALKVEKLSKLKWPLDLDPLRAYTHTYPWASISVLVDLNDDHLIITNAANMRVIIITASKITNGQKYVQ